MVFDAKDKAEIENPCSTGGEMEWVFRVSF